MRLFLLLLLLLALVTGAVSCSVWKELGQKPDALRLAEFQSSPHFSTEQQIFLNRRPEVLTQMQERMDAGAIMDFFLNSTPDKTPAGPLPEYRPVDLQQFLAPTDSIRFIWLGHSSLLVNVQNHIVLLDPVFSKAASPVKFMVRRFQPPVVPLEALPEIEWILISHDHYDHLDLETIEFFKERKTRFAVPLGVGSHLRYWGIPEERIVELDWWEQHQDGDLTLSCTPAQHFSGRTGQEQKTLWASWVLEAGERRLFFSGDSGYDVHYQQIGSRFERFDLAFVDSGQYNEKWREVHNMPEEAVQAAKDLNADHLIPIHWGMFELALHEWYDPVVRSHRSAQEQSVSLLTPKIGQLVEFEQPEASERWWEALMP